MSAVPIIKAGRCGRRLGGHPGGHHGHHGHHHGGGRHHYRGHHCGHPSQPEAAQETPEISYFDVSELKQALPNLSTDRTVMITSCHEPSIAGKSTADFTMLIAWIAIHRFNCTLFGGFIRDFVIRGEAPHDIDLRIPGADRDTFLLSFASALNEKGLGTNFVAGKVKGHKVYIPGGVVEVDLVCHTEFKGGATVDLDVNNLQVTRGAGLQTRAPLGKTLAETVTEILQKRATITPFYLGDSSKKEYMQKRVQKMQDRGWNILNAKAL